MAHSSPSVSCDEMIVHLAEIVPKMRSLPAMCGVFMMLNNTRNVGGRTRHAAVFVPIEHLQKTFPFVWERVKTEVSAMDPEKVAVLYVEFQTHKRGLSTWRSGCMMLPKVPLTVPVGPQSYQNIRLTSVRLCARTECPVEGDERVCYKCGACKAIYYCGETCQLLDWKSRHKGLCQKLNQQRRQERCVSLV
jgi:hypothetical protein